MKCLLFCLLILSFNTNAEVFRTSFTKINSLLVHENQFGGCAVRINDDIQTITGGRCGALATFSCTSELMEYENAHRLWETAQLAYVTGKDVRLHIDSNKQHNGQCLVFRIDVQ